MVALLARTAIGPGRIASPILPVNQAQRFALAINASLTHWETHPEIVGSVELWVSKDGGVTWGDGPDAVFTFVGGPIPPDPDDNNLKKLPSGVLSFDPGVTHVRAFLSLNRVLTMGLDGTPQ